MDRCESTVDIVDIMGSTSYRVSVSGSTSFVTRRCVIRNTHLVTIPSLSLAIPLLTLSSSLLLSPHPSSSLLIPSHPFSSLLIPSHPFSSLLFVWSLVHLSLSFFRRCVSSSLRVSACLKPKRQNFIYELF